VTVGAVDTAVFDVDGTLVDTNYQHALAWYRAFRRFGTGLPVWRLHRAIGMGGDQLVAAVAGDDVEAEHGDDLRAAWSEEYAPMLHEVQAFDGVRDLLTDVAKRGLTIVLASSGAPDHVESYLDLFDGRSLAAAWLTSKDVDRTKPQPDLLQRAVERVGGSAAVLVGDSVWDLVAADHAGIPGYGLRTGGFSPDELRGAGAREVFESIRDLHDGLDRTLLRGAARRDGES
jgi:HAD superfamily hydrolase (TIGR01549 family)